MWPPKSAAYGRNKTLTRAKELDSVDAIKTSVGDLTEEEFEFEQSDALSTIYENQSTMDETLTSSEIQEIGKTWKHNSDAIDRLSIRSNAAPTVSYRQNWTDEEKINRLAICDHTDEGTTRNKHRKLYVIVIATIIIVSTFAIIAAIVAIGKMQIKKNSYILYYSMTVSSCLRLFTSDTLLPLPPCKSGA